MTSRSEKRSARRSWSSRTPNSFLPNANRKQQLAASFTITAWSAISMARSIRCRIHGQILDHRYPGKDHRSLPAAVRGLWLYGGIPDLSHVPRCARHAHLCRQQRDHETPDRTQFVMPDMSQPSPGESKYTTGYMCACRCGIKVHLRDGRIRYIEGNRNHPVNRGVICAKGSAGIMQQYSPARLSKPLLRSGERGRGEFREIEWDEALGLACQWLGRIRATDPRKLAFFTGRDQSQSLTGWWAKQFGTPNYAAHGGFCSVNMAAAGLYTIGGSFWEFGEP